MYNNNKDTDSIKQDTQLADNVKQEEKEKKPKKLFTYINLDKISKKAINIFVVISVLLLVGVLFGYLIRAIVLKG